MQNIYAATSRNIGLTEWLFLCDYLFFPWAVNAPASFESQFNMTRTFHLPRCSNRDLAPHCAKLSQCFLKVLNFANKTYYRKINQRCREALLRNDIANNRREFSDCNLWKNTYISGLKLTSHNNIMKDLIIPTTCS